VKTRTADARLATRCSNGGLTLRAQVSLVSLGDVEARVSFRGDLASRPRWAASTLSWGLDLADFEVVPVKLTGFELEHATMLWSVFIRCTPASLLLSLPFALAQPLLHT